VYQLPPLPVKKKPQPPYRKPDAVRELERMADAEVQKRYENVEAKYLCPRRFRDDDANSLTACIVAYAKLCGSFASRLNNTGIYRNGKYTRSTSRRGLPDVLITRNGQSLFIEVKTGRDRMSKYQEAVRDDQQKSGGLYFVAHDFSSFKQWFDNLT